MATTAEPETRADPLDYFRKEVRAWLEENFPKSLAFKENALASIEGPGDSSPDAIAWKKAAADKGWGAPTWPKQYGGAGLDRKQVKIVQQEMARIGAWNPIGGLGLMMFGPTLLEYGTDKQKAEHLPPIARGEKRWCQGYSEPSAGSDLAALQCKAEDKGDHFLINGQKTWTSGGQWADGCFGLFRTDPTRKHEGISFLIVDMHAPGVEVRPIRMISGASPFCDTFFTDVKVPKENLVGELNKGWDIGKRLLQHERTNLSGGNRLASLAGPSLSETAKKYVGTDEAGRIADAELRARIVRHEMDWRSFLLTANRVVQEAKETGGVSTASSILKKMGTQLGQERQELLLEIMGMQALGWEGEGFSEKELQFTRGWLFGKATTIYGGSTEIQNNVIAKRILGMLDHQ